MIAKLSEAFITHSCWWAETLTVRHHRTSSIYSYIRVDLDTHAPLIAKKETFGTY